MPREDANRNICFRIFFYHVADGRVTDVGHLGKLLVALFLKDFLGTQLAKARRTMLIAIADYDLLGTRYQTEHTLLDSCAARFRFSWRSSANPSL